jgi:hypothetical protein
VGAFLDALLVAGCRHERHDEPDEMGDALCFICEQKVRVVLTEKALMHTFNRMAEMSGMEAPFDGA